MYRPASNHRAILKPPSSTALVGSLPGINKHLLTLVVASVLTLAGCSKDLAGDLHVLEHYGDVIPQKFQFEGETFGVLDRPEQERMIVVSLGPWWGVSEELMARTNAAAEEYLQDSQRICTVDSMRLASSTDGELRVLLLMRVTRPSNNRAIRHE